jgi:hypothetical protein
MGFASGSRAAPHAPSLKFTIPIDEFSDEWSKAARTTCVLCDKSKKIIFRPETTLLYCCSFWGCRAARNKDSGRHPGAYALLSYSSACRNARDL